MEKETKKNEKISKIDILESLAKDFSLVRDKDYIKKTEAIPSGSLALDLALGIGGYPRGAIIDIYGEESSGKSLLTIMTIAQLQRKGGIAVIWDAERSYSKNMEWMRINGVDTSKVFFLKLKPEQPAEDGFNAIEEICKNKAADLIVIDSIPSLVPQAMLEKNIGDSIKIGARAALLTNVLPRLTSLADENDVTIMTINQIRAAINTSFYGPTERETSIFALKHYSTIRMEVSKINKSVKFENEIPIGHRIKVKIVKNKVAAPGKVCEFEINYTKGVNNIMETAEILISTGLAKRKGAWIEYEGKKMQGINGLYEELKQNKELYKKSIEKIKEVANNSSVFGVLSDENIEVKYDDIPDKL